MRSTRLLALLMELSRAPQRNVRQLAARHGVTPRTIQRDIAALHELGVPIWTRTGPGGGVGLVDGWRSPLTGMTAAELQALLLGDAGSRALGLESDYATARLKMLTANRLQADVVQPVQERFLVDNERWFTEPERPVALTEVARAVWSGRRLRIRYESPRSGSTAVTRTLDPLGLVLKTEAWYLVAAHRHRLRTYRLIRVREARVLEEPGWRPEKFSLAEHWGRSRTAFEASLGRLPVTLRIPSGSAAALVAAVPGSETRRAIDGAAQGAARLTVELQMESLEVATAALLGVPEVEVLAPADLRLQLFRRGQQLAAHNR
ncbi:helix-turn-helix transcriptional regulator [Nesterenkonia halotolerans]|uniref:DNA-binding transcriptional regulator YafY n=1 Tax=Nesterenkonia halotolerans TaxID=225325 RepID=A0ABR9J7M8_9MICC|nr:WYL domain-containing protein [Nesterenkonia halotolerans]MBE1515003.1 putative DNA-binding transcriptional regulator YafY [Nesterenkonia halotolerans]